MTGTPAPDLTPEQRAVLDRIATRIGPVEDGGSEAAALAGYAEDIAELAYALDEAWDGDDFDDALLGDLAGILDLVAERLRDRLAAAESCEPCWDCKRGTAPDPADGKYERYMVRDEVWRAAGAMGGYLCIYCLEQRLGRELTAADFKDLPINRPHSSDTARLQDRLSRTGG